VWPIFFDRVVLGHPKAVVFCVAAAVCFLALQARHFRLDASAETLVLENDEDLGYARMVGSRYGEQDFLVVTYSPRGDLFSQQALANLAGLRDDLGSVGCVESVLSILDVPLLESPPLSLAELKSELPVLNSPSVDKELAKRELRESPIYRSLLVSSDLRNTALLVYFPEDVVYRELLGRRNELRALKSSGSLAPAQRAEMKAVVEQFGEYRDQLRRRRHEDIASIRSVMDKYRGDAELFLGGVGMVADDMITFIKNDLKVFGIGVLVFLIIMLGIIFGRLRWIVVPMLCCVISTICMIGLLGWFGWEVTVISSNFISLQIIITLAIAIHLVVRYRELLAGSPAGSNRQLVLETIRLKLKPCVYAVLTTIAGFGSLVLCDILPVITFGWMMIAGLVVSLIVTFLVFPAALILVGKGELPGAGWWRFSLTSVLARFTEAHGGAVLGVSGLMLVLSVVGIGRLEVENSFIDYFKKDTEIYQGMKLIDEQLGGTTPLDVIVDFEGPDAPAAAVESLSGGGDDIFDEFDEFDEEAGAEKYWFTAEKMRRVKAVHRNLESLPETGKVMSLANILAVAESLNEGEALDSFELALLYSETPDEFKKLLVSPYVSVEHNEVRFSVRVRDSEETLRRDELLKQIRRELGGILNVDSERVHLSGLLVLYNNMLQSLFGSQIVTLGITMLVLTAMFLVLFRSLRIAVVAMFPNLLSIGAVLGVMGWLNIPLDMMTITIAAISVGIAVDDTIHYIHRFKSEFEKDRSYTNTMHRCHGSIGHAMYYTSVTIIIGFSILGLSSFIPCVYFGLLTGLAMLIALIAALTLLPRLLILTKPFGKGI
jgi:hypothetical protein